MGRTSTSASMFARLLLTFLAGLALVLPASAQETAKANPSLTAEVDGIDSKETRSDALRFSDFSLAIKTQGNIADAELTVTIQNPGDDELEAQFAFQLPRGAAVTGYAIDLEDPAEGMEGQLIDGVLLEEKKAKTAYENQVRGQIDPGLAGVSREGVFSTSIYPVNYDGGTRRMRLNFSFPITPGMVWPVRLDQPAGNWKIELDMQGLKAQPAATLLDNRQVTKRGLDRYGASAAGADSIIDGEIKFTSFELPESLISKHKSGDEFVHLSGRLPKAGPTQKPELLRVYWDNSLSRKQGDVDKDRQIAVDIAAALDPGAVELVSFDAGYAETSRYAEAAALGNELSERRYAGGSSLAALAKASPLAEAGLCLMFYDGLATVEREADFDPNCRLQILSSVPGANAAKLSALARKYGGEFHFISAATDQAALVAQITSGAPVLQAIRGDSGKALPFIPLPAPDGYWAAVIKSQRDLKLTVRLAAGGKQFRREISVDAGAEKYDGAGALWAKSELAERNDGLDREGFLAFARKYSVEYPGLSFLVLEDPEDYVTNDIDPPANYPKELRAEYREAREEADTEEREEKEARFADLLKDWDELKEWWAEEYNAADWRKARKMAGGTASEAGDAAAEAAASESLDVYEEGPPEEQLLPPPPTVSPVQAVAPAFPGRSGSSGGGGYCDEDGQCFQEIIVTGTYIQPKIGVTIDAWQPDRPYLKALDAAGDDYTTVFASEEQKHGSLPAFYLDVSRWQTERGEKEAALRTLLSALELPVANDETILIVAQRLLRYGQYDRAIDLLEGLAARQEFLPQPKRHLALALLKRARSGNASNAKDDYERAVALLYGVAINPLRDGDEGLDLIALLEANSAIPSAKSSGAKVDVDDRLVALLDTDIRVVVDWTTESTDLDLWVIEPSGEKAYYGNQSTDIGGHMSDDMTDGYGPEEYMVRKAMPGDYQVRAHVYSSDRINPNGTSVLTARLIRNFGRADESEEYVDIELGKPKRPDPEGDADADEQDDEEGDRKIGVLTVVRPK
jgi:hypothetical protein